VVDLTAVATRRILIVEDEEYCASTLEIALLTLPNVEVQLALSAVEALDSLRSGCQVSCVLTDLRLGVMNGFELIARLRSEGRTANLPIVVISGDSEPETRDRLFHLGINAYFTKPYSAVKLCQQVAQLLDIVLSDESAGS
jgi:CheY-like chemotaxis protein